MKATTVKVAAALALAIAFLAGRLTAPLRLLGDRVPSDQQVAKFDGGALSAAEVGPALAGIDAPEHRRAAVEQLVRIRLFASDAEAAGLHRTPEFLGRYAEELARLQIQKAFEEPFQKQLPTDDEVRKFFDENRTKLGRPERARIAHVALLAPASDPAARRAKHGDAEKILADARRTAKDDYAFGQLALVRSEDARSRPAAGELPFLTRDELVAQLGPEMADVAFTVAPGRIVERVVETAHGFHVVKVLAREEGREASFDELREAIKARLSAERRERAYDEFTKARWARGGVEIDDQALAKLASSSPGKTTR
jgi:hypothetical protein